MIIGGYVLPPVGGSSNERFAVSATSGKKARSQLNLIIFLADAPITADMVVIIAASIHGEDDRFAENVDVGLLPCPLPGETRKVLKIVPTELGQRSDHRS